MSKFREVIDGDTWFFVKPIVDNGQLGVGPYSGDHIKIYASGRSASKHGKFSTRFGMVYQVPFDHARELVANLKKCKERSSDVSNWVDGYIIHEIVLENGAVIHFLSLDSGKVQMKFVTTDVKGIDYMICATEIVYILEPETVDEFIALVEKVLEG